MRQGRILAEGNPSYLMLQHNVVSMERLFLKLSQQDDFRHQDYQKDIFLQLEKNHHHHNANHYLESNGTPTMKKDAAATIDPSTVVYSNGSASFVKTKSHLLSLAPPPPTTVAFTSNNTKTQQHPIEQYKQLDPDSLINEPSMKSSSTTNNNCKLNNNDYNDSSTSSLLFANNNLPMGATSSVTRTKSTKSLSGPNNNKSRTYSVHGQDRSVNSLKKVGVLCKKHRIRLFRRVPELVITMLLPALEVALFCLCMGRDPTSVQMAVCNQENPPFLSLLFLKSIDSDFIALKYYKTPEEAINSVRNADTYSAIVLAKNFSTALKNFGQGGFGGGGNGFLPGGSNNNGKLLSMTIAEPSTTTEAPSSMYTIPLVPNGSMAKLVTNTNEPVPPLMTPYIAPSQPTQSMLRTGLSNDQNVLRRLKRNISDLLTTTVVSDELVPPTDDDDSVIRIYYDGSNALHVNIIRREVFSALFRFVENAGKLFGGHFSGYKLPIKFEKPIYGGEKTDMVEFVGPGLMVFIVFFATMSITSMAFLSERREGM